MSRQGQHITITNNRELFISSYPLFQSHWKLPQLNILVNKKELPTLSQKAHRNHLHEQHLLQSWFEYLHLITLTWRTMWPLPIFQISSGAVCFTSSLQTFSQTTHWDNTETVSAVQQTVFKILPVHKNQTWKLSFGVSEFLPHPHETNIPAAEKLPGISQNHIYQPQHVQSITHWVQIQACSYWSFYVEEFFIWARPQ